MSLHLRPYQEDLLERTRAALRRCRRVLVQAPTGAGKTVLAAYMIAGAYRRGLSAMVLLHRAELVSQTRRTLDLAEVPHGVIAPGYPETSEPVQVASIATVAKRLDRIRLPDMLFVDEAHHAVASSWSRVLTALSSRWVVGLSATPARLDGRGLRGHFDELVPGPGVRELIELGALSDYVAYAPAGIDMTGARVVAGDYSKAEIARRADRPCIVGDAVAHYRELALGKRAVVFCVSIEHARHVAEGFQAAGIAASYVNGSMDAATRAMRLGDLEQGIVPVLTSVDLVSEGFDLPAIEVAISLRPTASTTLWLQQVGRALRPAPGKEKAIILDHAGNIARHGLPDEPREWTLDGSSAPGEQARPAPAIRICKTCEAVYRPAPRCPVCGAEHVPEPRQVDEVAGQLVEIDREALRERRYEEIRNAKTLAELAKIARERGYKPGWAYHVARARAFHRR